MARDGIYTADLAAKERLIKMWEKRADQVKWKTKEMNYKLECNIFCNKNCNMIKY